MNQQKIISLLFLILCTSISIAQAETDLEELIEKGDLKTRPIGLLSIKKIDIDICFNAVAKINEMYLDFTSFKGKGSLIKESKYNSEGNLIEESKYNSEGNFGCYYKYDNQGNLIEEINYYFYSSIEYKYEYDDQGNLIETISITMVE